MKYLTLLTILSTALATPLQHQHHQHARENIKRAIVTKVIYVDSNGNQIQGSATETASPTTVQAISAPETSAANPVVPSGSTTESVASAVASAAGGILGDLSNFANPNQKFEDGVYDCDQVPTGQGVVAVDWISGLTGGWTTIMNENGDTSSTCQDGYYCSYACQAGMSKTQWPSEQPASGISVGGLYCKNGKLFRSNTDNDYLCQWGANNVNFVSEISKDVAICRTDYPGSENMNIPTLLEAGNTAPVSVVDSDTYFTWRGGKTSTQYYVNNAGVSIEDGCIWGTEGSGVGNWAPVVLGAGTTGGKTYLSLIPNPNNKEQPNYNIKIVGDDVNGNCKYENGQYNGAGSDGCTVTVNSGNAKFVFY
ncbi:SIM1 Secreted beta-glucosidase SIM1 [Candida maltosa Xu316]|uniref:Protein NCA3, mitochondrial n=1 Tax=Candida maltosa (strain Xu316) TaxID=1245528 RepID=M3K599_CANMX|nr:Protein NCA3, mitochondrial [Candida maltosa Xu316]